MERSEQMKLEQIRDRLFPSWYLYSPSIVGTALMPTYQVVCDTFDDYLVARMAKPSFVKAKITYKPK